MDNRLECCGLHNFLFLFFVFSLVWNTILLFLLKNTRQIEESVVGSPVNENDDEQQHEHHTDDDEDSAEHEHHSEENYYEDDQVSIYCLSQQNENQFATIWL